MTMKCQINRNTTTRNWNNDGNVVMSDGFDRSEARFSPLASDETILREYLKGYGLNAEEDGSYAPGWMEIEIVSKPADQGYCKTFYVLSDGEWATVTDQMPVGELRADGYRY